MKEDLFVSSANETKCLHPYRSVCPPASFPGHYLCSISNVMFCYYKTLTCQRLRRFWCNYKASGIIPPSKINRSESFKFFVNIFLGKSNFPLNIKNRKLHSFPPPPFFYSINGMPYMRFAEYFLERK